MASEYLNWIEWVGYLASILIIWSFMLTNMRTLRMINALGCLAFVAYGFLLQISWPIVITNVFIFCVHIYYLTRKSPA
jgi:hypothetical protein